MKLPKTPVFKVVRLCCWHDCSGVLSGLPTMHPKRITSTIKPKARLSASKSLRSSSAMYNPCLHPHLLLALGVITLFVGPPCLAVSGPSNAGTSPSVAILEGHEWRISPPAEDESQTWPHRGLVRRIQPYISFHGGDIDGSSGCGTLAGKYQGSGSRMSVVVTWNDAPEMRCDDEDRGDASQIVAALNRVQKVSAKPDYWREDSFLLTDGKEEMQIVLSPMRTGSDLSDLTDTFWSFSKLDGAAPQLSDAIIWIQLRRGYSQLCFLLLFIPLLLRVERP